MLDAHFEELTTTRSGQDQHRVHNHGRYTWGLQPGILDQRNGCPFGYGRNKLQWTWRRKG
jgi:hypothetical protein